MNSKDSFRKFLVSLEDYIISVVEVAVSSRMDTGQVEMAREKLIKTVEELDEND